MESGGFRKTLESMLDYQMCWIGFVFIELQKLARVTSCEVLSAWGRWVCELCAFIDGFSFSLWPLLLPNSPSHIFIWKVQFVVMFWGILENWNPEMINFWSKKWVLHFKAYASMAWKPSLGTVSGVLAVDVFSVSGDCTTSLLSPSKSGKCLYHLYGSDWIGLSHKAKHAHLNRHNHNSLHLLLLCSSKILGTISGLRLILAKYDFTYWGYICLL